MFYKRCLNHIRWPNQSFNDLSLRDANLEGAEIFGHSIYPEAIGNYDGRDLWWLVLAKDEDNHRVLLLALDCVATREYHGESEDITWKECDLRRWLNGVFLRDAFYGDYERINPVTIHTNDNPEYNTSGGEDAEGDKLFLLSLEELREYFAVTEYYTPDDNLVACLNGIRVWWWLRSPGIRSYGVASVRYDGSVYVNGTHVSWPGGGVRPAFWLNLQS